MYWRNLTATKDNGVYMAENANVPDDMTSLKVSLPLTQPTGKIRIKQRNFFSENLMLMEEP